MTVYPDMSAIEAMRQQERRAGMRKGLFVQGEEVHSDPIFLNTETSQPASTLTGLDARCIVCLEPCYRLWTDHKNFPPAGCPSGHTRKEDCIEHAVPIAEFRGQLRELKRRGLLK